MLDHQKDILKGEHVLFHGARAILGAFLEIEPNGVDGLVAGQSFREHGL